MKDIETDHQLERQQWMDSIENLREEVSELRKTKVGFHDYLADLLPNHEYLIG